MKPVKVGVIGVGYLGKFHAEKYAQLPEADLVGVADADLETARDVGRKLGVPAYADYRQVLERADALSIVVPTELHHAIAMDCLEQGADVLVEKLGHSHASAKRMIKEAFGRNNTISSSEALFDEIYRENSR